MNPRAGTIPENQRPVGHPDKTSSAGPVAIAVAAGSVVALVSIAGSTSMGLLTTMALGILGGILAARRTESGLADVLLILACISVLSWAIPLVTDISGLSKWISGAPPELGFAVANGLKVIALVPLLAVLAIRRWTPGRLMCGIGRPSARAPVLRLSWHILGPIAAVAVLLAFLTAPEVLAADHSRAESTAILLKAMPMLFVGPLINAVCEELLYRHALVSSLTSVTHPLIATAVSSAIFGVAHLAGNPGGPSGVIAASIFGLVCCGAMLNTRSFVWNLTIHVAADIGILSAILLSAT